MKYILLLLSMNILLYSANISLIVLADKKQVLSKEVLSSVKSSMVDEMTYFSEKHSIDTIVNVDENFKTKYATDGFVYLQKFAVKHKSDIIIKLEYKKGARSVSIHLFIADGKNMSKNEHIRYSSDLKEHLSKLISNKILKLLIETGQLNEKNRYL